MDPQLQTLAVQLGEVALRNTAGAVSDRISAARAKKKNEETIAELEEIVNGPISDKAQLVRIAQAFEQELVSQRISDEDVEYITSSIVPVLTRLMELGNDGEEVDDSAQQMMQVIQPILSVETVTVLQLIGFNFKQAIGEPLTELVRNRILAQGSPDPAEVQQVQRLSLQRELAYIEVARDPEAHARLLRMFGSQEN